MPTPSEVLVRSYAVGFGDCFVLVFRYAEDSQPDLHALIDFGSTRWPKTQGSQYTKEYVARDIVRQANGNLKLVAATHRHADHINGFIGEPFKTFETAKPGLVIQPWTEHPEVAEDADREFGAGADAYLDSLESMHIAAAAMSAIADSLDDRIKANHTLRTSPDDVRRLRFVGELNVKNKSAVENLHKLGTSQKYVKAGDNLAEADHGIPGLEITVLGPPTVANWNQIRKQRDEHPEFWGARGS